MCGIGGYLSFDGFRSSDEILDNMASVMTHRGPDGAGTYRDGSLGLCHRRLSIIDLSENGLQPMQSEDGRFVISYNGEVFNFRELKRQLEVKGIQFRTKTDTEVVLKSLMVWGTEALLKFNGQFALAFWDRKKKELWLARDRYGIKPLYFSQRNGCLAFASEIKPIFQHPNFAPDLDVYGLSEYLSFQNFFTERTLFSGVEILPPATLMRVSGDGTQHCTKYWDFCFQEPEIGKKEVSKDEYREELDFLIQNAVKRQLMSDVEVGSYLSGGLDSGTITSIASKTHPGMKTFTCGFDLNSASGIELGMDERQVAEHLSYVFGTEHYQVVLKAGDMERILPKLVYHLEEPRVGQSYPNFYVAQLASKFTKVVLSGDGGDELFAGYPWRYYRAVTNSSFDNYIEKYHRFWQRLLTDQMLSRVMKPTFRHGIPTPSKTIFKNIFPFKDHTAQRPEDYINMSLYFESKTFLHGLLVTEDKISMANSLETRVPFLDNDLVDFAMLLPVKYKLGNLGKVAKLDENERGAKAEKYFKKTRDGKLILREVMEHHVSRRVARGEKKGFSAPDASWFKGDSMGYVREKLMNKNGLIYGYLDRTTIFSELESHLDGKQNKRLLIWSLLNLEVWLETLESGAWTRTKT